MPKQSPIQWRQFSGGLWVAGSFDEVPDGNLRRASAAMKLRTTSGWIRPGAIERVAGGGHVMTSYFFGDDFGGADGGRFYYNLSEGLVYANGTPIYVGAYNNVSSGIQRRVPINARLTFSLMSPSVGYPLWLYAAGGLLPIDSSTFQTRHFNWHYFRGIYRPRFRGILQGATQTPIQGSFKVDPATGLSWRIGIEPPPDGMQASTGSLCYLPNETYFWTPTSAQLYSASYWDKVHGLTASDDTVNVQTGVASLKLNIGANHKAAHIYHTGSLDLSTPAGTAPWSASTYVNSPVIDPNGNTQVGTNLPSFVLKPYGIPSGYTGSFVAGPYINMAVCQSRVDESDGFTTLTGNFVGTVTSNNAANPNSGVAVWGWLLLEPTAGACPGNGSLQAAPQVISSQLMTFTQTAAGSTLINTPIPKPAGALPGDRIILWASSGAEGGGSSNYQPFEAIDSHFTLRQHVTATTLNAALIDCVVGADDPDFYTGFTWEGTVTGANLLVWIGLIRGSNDYPSVGLGTHNGWNLGSFHTFNDGDNMSDWAQATISTPVASTPYSMLRLDLFCYNVVNDSNPASSLGSNFAGPPQIETGASAPSWSQGLGDITYDNGITWQNEGNQQTQEADNISLWVACDYPDNVAYLRMIFEDSNSRIVQANIALNTNTVSQVAGTNALTVTQLGPVTGISGIGSLVSTPGTQVVNKPLYGAYRLQPLRFSKSEYDLVTTGAWEASPGQSINTNDPTQHAILLATMQRAPNVVGSADTGGVTWHQITIAKGAFVAGKHTKAGNFDWASITKWGFRIATNAAGSANIWLDGASIAQGPGMLGNYGYVQCFANSRANIISNSNPTTVYVDNVQREPVTLTNIQQPNDPQVDTIIIYRTVGGGAQLFFQGAYPVGTLAVTDFDNDYESFGPSSYPTLGVTDIWPQALQYDNIPPDPSWTRLCGDFNGCMFYAGNPDNPWYLYYSPPGRPESVANYLNLGAPIQNMVVWNNSLFVWTSEALWQVQPLTSEYIAGIPFFDADVIVGAPGTAFPFSISPGRNNILYQSSEGLVAFNGSFTQEIMNEMGPIFQDRPAENLVAMSTVSATFARGEWWLSDAAHQTLILNEATKAWRNEGLVTDGLFFEDSIDVLFGWIDQSTQVAGAAAISIDSIASLEDASQPTTDVGQPIPWEVQTGGKLLSLAQQSLIKRVIFDVNPNGQTLTPTIVTDAFTLTLPTLTGVSRARFEYDFIASAQVVAPRLAGNVTAYPEIYSVEVEVEGGQPDA